MGEAKQTGGLPSYRRGNWGCGSLCRARCRSGPLTSPAVLARAMRSRLGDQTRKMISCGSCFSPTTRKDGKQVGKRNMGAAVQWHPSRRLAAAAAALGPRRPRGARTAAVPARPALSSQGGPAGLSPPSAAQRGNSAPPAAAARSGHFRRPRFLARGRGTRGCALWVGAGASLGPHAGL